MKTFYSSDGIRRYGGGNCVHYVAEYLHCKVAITSKIKHAIKLKTSPARLAQLLQNLDGTPSLAAS